MTKHHSYHGRAIIEQVGRIFEDKPEWVPALAEYQIKMNTGFFDQWYMDAVVQVPSWQPYDIYDAYCFSQVHTMIFEGLLFIGQVELGYSPAGDREQKLNNTMLMELPCPFEAEFQGGARESHDGWFAWNEDIELGQLDKDGEEMACTFGPDSVCLEVGYTLGSRTLLHITEGRGVARWPYDSTYVHLFRIDDAQYSDHLVDVPRAWVEPQPLQPELFDI